MEGNNIITNEDVMKKILQNQRHIMEQNSKILQQHEETREENREYNKDFPGQSPFDCQG